jgi:hypothetical protein
MNDKRRNEVSELAPPAPLNVDDPVKVPPVNVPPAKFPPPKRENVVGGNNVYTMNAFAALSKPPNKETPRSFFFDILRFLDTSREPSTSPASMRGITVGAVGIVRINSWSVVL